MKRQVIIFTLTFIILLAALQTTWIGKEMNISGTFMTPIAGCARYMGGTVITPRAGISEQQYTLNSTSQVPTMQSEIETLLEQEQVEPLFTYSEEDLYLLSHLIQAEAGSNYCSDELQLGVGSVVLNRVAHSRFPDNLRDVIYQPGQYACISDGHFDLEASNRSRENAQYLLEHGSQLPSNVIYQAEFIQGSGVYSHVQNTYFCYE